MTTLASVNVIMGANTARFHKKLEAAQKQTKKFDGGLKKMAKGGATALAAIGAAAVASLGVLTGQMISAGTEARRFSQSLGTTTKDLTSWQYAAERVGISGEKMADIFKDVNDKIGDFATTGGGGAADLFEKLNLDVSKFVGLSPDKQLLKIGEALDQVGTQAEKTFFLEAIASDSSQLLPLLENNAAKFREIQREAEIFGTALNDIDAAKMQQVSDELSRSGGAIKGLGNAIAAKVSPQITAIAKGFNDWILSIGGFGGIVNKVFSGIVTAVAFVLDAIYPLELIFNVLKLGALELGNKFVQAMASMKNGVADFINKALTPVRAYYSTLIQSIVTGAAFIVEQLAKVGLATEGAADRIRAKGADLKSAMLETLTIEPGEIQTLADRTQAAVDAQAEKIAGMVNGPTRGEQLRQWVADNEAAANQAAAAAVAAEQAKTNAALVEGVKRSALEQFEFEQTLLTLNEKYGQSVITRDIYNEIELQQKRIHENNLTEVEKAAAKQRIKQQEDEAKKRQAAMSGLWSNLQSLQNSKSRKMFEIGKAAAISEAVISTIKGAQDSYSALAGIPIIGPALGAAAAAAAIAAGAVRVQQIKAQKFQGGGSAPSNVATSTPSASAASPSIPAAATPTADTPAADAAAQSRVQVVINGNVSGNDARRLVSEMVDIINQDDIVLIDPNSRNGQELAAAAQG